MGTKYLEHISPKATPQSRPIPGREAEMVKNAAGGYAFPVTEWVQLERFLILGSEGGTYYLGEQELTIRNAQAARKCLLEDARRVVDLIVDVNTNNRAAKVEPALMVLAMASAPQYNPNDEHRAYALSKLREVCRIGTHLFTFVSYVNAFRGWGRALRNAVAGWYTEMPVGRLAYQMAKYQQRGGWSHHDVMHLAHPRTENEWRNRLFRWAKDGWSEELSAELVDGMAESPYRSIVGLELAKQATTAKEIVKLIQDYRLTREMIPNKWFNEPAVWEAMLEHMPLFALMRNVGKMTQVGLIAQMSDVARHVVERLSNEEAIKRARIHPWGALNAAHWYEKGHGMLGNLRWSPVQSVADALEEVFYTSFGNIEPSGKRVVLAIDTSGSMFAQSQLTVAAVRNGRAVHGMHAVQAAAAMAMITARTEPNHMILLFDWGHSMYRRYYGRSQVTSDADRTKVAHISPKSRLSDVARDIEREGLKGGTDYAEPINYLQRNKIEADAVVIYGDEQSWGGAQHASQAIKSYREAMGLPTKLVVNNFCSYRSTVVDPDDGGSAFFIGMDTNTPRLIADFVRE